MASSTWRWSWQGVVERRASLFPTRILLATDGSEDARRAVKTAIALSTKLNSELHFRRGHNSLS